MSERSHRYCGQLTGHRVDPSDAIWCKHGSMFVSCMIDDPFRKKLRIEPFRDMNYIPCQESLEGVEELSWLVRLSSTIRNDDEGE